MSSSTTVPFPPRNVPADIRLGWTLIFPLGFRPEHALLDTQEKVDLAIFARDERTVVLARKAILELAEMCGVHYPIEFSQAPAPCDAEEQRLP